ncbi:MAG: DUF4097 domain-containing protein, partial [Bacilli bacterium]|nr:DUF4097 domain-containing protein [Bacilli bacterium]
MQNKALIITNIILLSCLVVGLVMFMFFGLNNGFTFEMHSKNLLDTKEYAITDFSSLKTNLKSYDLRIEESKNSNVTVEVYSSKGKNDIRIELQNNTLSINQVGSTFCFGFCFSSNEIVVYIPKNNQYKFNLKTISGDISVKIPITTPSEIETTSGDIYASFISNGITKSTSGEIVIDHTENMNASTTSGDIIIKKVEQLNAKSTSGDINISNLTASGNLKTTSGEINVSEFTIKEDSEMSSTSGDITVNLTNEASVNASSRSGDKDIKYMRNGIHELKLTTTSGDITVR